MKSRRLRTLIVVALLLITVGCAVVLADWWSVTPQGSDWPKIVIERMLVISMLAIACTPFLFLRRLRLIATRVTLFGLLCVAVFMIASRFGRNIRYNAFCGIAGRGDALASAIEAYIKHKGSPPSTLRDLVPDYLAHVPSTGIAAYPEYSYKRHESRDTWKIWVPVGSELRSESVVFLGKQETESLADSGD